MKRQLKEGQVARYKHQHRLVTFNRPISAQVPVWRFTTHAQVLATDGTVIAEGDAICRPEDQFSRKIGRDISLGRALKSLEPPKQRSNHRSLAPEHLEAEIDSLPEPIRSTMLKVGRDFGIVAGGSGK